MSCLCCHVSFLLFQTTCYLAKMGPTYLTQNLFLKSLSAIYLIAFLSLYMQLPGKIKTFCRNKAGSWLKRIVLMLLLSHNITNVHDDDAFSLCLAVSSAILTFRVSVRGNEYPIVSGTNMLNL